MNSAVTLVLFGALLIALGVTNLRGNIQTIHWYNRRRITEETRLPYARAIGTGTLTIGCTLILCALLDALLQSSIIYLLLIPGLLVGLGFMLYAQFKFNHGIF